MTDSLEDRRYAVVTTYDGSKLARVPPVTDRRRGFWTDDEPERIWLMDRKTAEEIASRLSYNQPQVVGAKKATGWIEAQRDARLARAAEAEARRWRSVDTERNDSPSPEM